MSKYEIKFFEVELQKLNKNMSLASFSKHMDKCLAVFEKAINYDEWHFPLQAYTTQKVN